MSKKAKKFDAPEGAPTQETQVVTSADIATIPADQVAGEAPTTEGTPVAVKGFYLKSDTPDINGRTDYRFSKYNQMPKRAPRVTVKVDGEDTEMAITSSGSWATDESRGLNGYIKSARGYTGWVVFSPGVDPNDKTQFPNGLSFTSVDGSCAADPKRTPANPDTEKRRKELFSQAMAKKKEGKPAEAATEGTAAEAAPTEQATEGQEAAA